ncbi:MAG: FtsW/RodA/SpoVE family cell cycle protein [Ruminococcus flavefaciens]|nr:FtsW/RodA/SpoVE family cell cycle protein [Ruminococcus flavefaciens]MCM1360967.1 FtsW/RodA/SpoVE family cell cycle protein [Clostridiales bacterium]
MSGNKCSYVFSAIFVLLAHAGMLLNVFLNGNYSDLADIIILSGAVIGLDLVYFIIMPFFKQSTFTIDFLLILVLNMSVIFQSCFGGVHLSVKHYITCITALIACRAGYLLCRNHKWLQMQKKYFYIGIGILMLVIVTLTGSRSMWIHLGPITLQPSEFIKPLFVLACATSIAEQQKKHKILCFHVVYENFALMGITAAICLLQWWCRDLGSLPTFIGIYACGFLLRICYPKAKFSKKKLIGAGIVLLVVAIIGMKFAPAYVQERLHADIWNDINGNGYQQSQALIGIANGGWFGKGPGYGFLHNVFAHENDIVFATISEEWGLLYALMMVLAILIIVMLPLINPPRSYFHSTMAAGVCAAFTVQMALNIFGSCNMIPFTGVTIPFISSGGSSLMTSGFMTGMLVASQSPVFKPPKPHKKLSSFNLRRRKA